MRLPLLLFSIGILIWTSCKTVDRSSGSLASEGSQERSDVIYSAVVKNLEKSNKDSKGRLWFESKGNLAEDWIIQSPPEAIGRSANNQPSGFTCTAGSKGCDTVFTRMLCSNDTDCSSTNTTCRFLDASQSPILPARKMCLSDADSLLDRYYHVITSAEKHLDFTSLSYPNGDFNAMMANALAMLAMKDNSISVRILVSGYDVAQVNVLQKPESVYPKIWKGIETAYGTSLSSSKLKLEVGYLSFSAIDLKRFFSNFKLTFPTWNHSKIVIADQKRMIEGGHNLWGADYLSDNPIFDISLETSGSIARESQDFVNYLWAKVPYRYSNTGSSISAPDLGEADSGNVAMIGVGRIDNIDSKISGNNPADDAIKVLIRSANSNVKFVVQDFYQTMGEIVARFYKGEPWMIDALAEAVLKGVKVQVVQSDAAAKPNSYVMLKAKDTFPQLVRLIESRSKSLPKPNLGGKSLRNFICDHFEYAPWRFKVGEKTWKNGTEIGGHSKLVIVDDAAFYLGSQNMYPAGLQEFGLIVANKDAVDDLNRQYWDKLWKESSPEKLPCP